MQSLTYCGPKWDGTPQRYWPSLAFEDNGQDYQMTTCLEYYKKYFGGLLKNLDKEINKLQGKINQLISLKEYHETQFEQFDFNRKL